MAVTHIPCSLSSALTRLEEAVADALDERLDEDVWRRRGGQLAVLLQGVDGLVGQVGADGVGAVTHQRAELVQLPRLAALYDQAHAAAVLVLAQASART